MNRVNLNIERQKEKSKKRRNLNLSQYIDYKTSMVIPYIEGFLRPWPGSINVMAYPRSRRPTRPSKSLLIHPKDIL